MRPVLRSHWLPTLLVLFAVTLFSGLSPTRLHAQAGSIVVTLKQPPPNQLKIADLWEIRLLNTTTQKLRVYLHGTVEEATDGLILDAQSTQLDVNPGMNIYNGNTVAPIKVNSSNSKYREPLLRTGNVPTGTYRVCVEAIQVSDNVVLGSDCITQPIQQLSPPVLTSPSDGATVQDKLPTFTWLPPSPMRPGQQVTYRMRIVEVIGRQTPYDAMTSNPYWFENTNIPSTILTYPLSSRSFIDNQKYAWKIGAFTSDGRLIGESEIWWFSYKPSSRDTGNVLRPKNPTIKTNPKDTAGGIKLIGTEVLVPGIRLTDITAKPNTTVDVGALDIVSKDQKKENMKKFLEGMLGTCSGSAITLKFSLDNLKIVSPDNKNFSPDKIKALPMPEMAPGSKP